MKLRTALFGIVILAALFLSTVGSPATAETVQYQDTVIAPEVTLVPPTVVVQITPGVPVTGETDAPNGLWTLILFGLLGLLGIAFLVALFSPRTVVHEHHDHPIDTTPHDHDTPG
jgi:hypothetical protein